MQEKLMISTGGRIIYGSFFVKYSFLLAINGNGHGMGY